MNRDFIKGGRGGGGHHFMKGFHKKFFFSRMRASLSGKLCLYRRWNFFSFRIPKNFESVSHSISSKTFLKVWSLSLSCQHSQLCLQCLLICTVSLWLTNWLIYLFRSFSKLCLKLSAVTDLSQWYHVLKLFACWPCSDPELVLSNSELQWHK